MSIREKCLIHTELKSDQVSILEKMVEHFGFLRDFYRNITVVVPGKDNEAVVISGKEIPKVISGDDIGKILGEKSRMKNVPVWIGFDGPSGTIIYRENKGTAAPSLERLLDLCIRCADSCYPADYLVPDGITVFDRQGQLRYRNCIAESMFSRLGFSQMSFQEVVQSLGIEADRYESFLAKPVFLGVSAQVEHFDVSVVINPIMKQGEFLGVLLVISDLSLIKKKEKELMEKSTVIKEIHHRVKNNLQTITSLLRLQMRRTNLRLVEKVFTESINRVLSIAMIHEALSKQDLEIINIKQTSYNILQMILSNMVDPHKAINGEIYGDDVYLSATLASSVSLCVTELVQNAVEHAFVNRTEGSIRVLVEQTTNEVRIKVEDNGIGLSHGKLQTDSSLGMQIVNTIIQHNLKGSFSIEGHRYGTSACIRFPKFNMEGVEV